MSGESALTEKTKLGRINKTAQGDINIFSNFDERDVHKVSVFTEEAEVLLKRDWVMHSTY